MNKAEGAFNILERARARVLHQMISERDLVISGKDIPEKLERDRKRIAFQIEKVQQERAALDLTKDKNRFEELSGRLLDLRRKCEAIIDDIRKASPRLADLRTPIPLNLTQVRSALDPGTAMLSYCVTEEKTYLFVVRKHVGLIVHTIEKGEPFLRDQIKAIHGLINDPDGAKGLAMLNDLSNEIFNKLIAPAKKEIEASSRLLIIPDGPLQKLPFNMLLDEKGQYLIEWKPITTVVSATIYAELKERKTRNTPQIAAFGDPLYSKLSELERLPLQIASLDAASPPKRQYADPDLRGFLRDNPNNLERLPYTAEEVRSIAGEYPGKTRLYLREQASEKNVKALGKWPSIIHLACHGWVNDRFPLESALAFTVRDVFGEGDENGILQAWEIFDSMRIDADLLILSACETGLGEITGGEGLMGLTRAFQFAGAVESFGI